MQEITLFSELLPKLGSFKKVSGLESGREYRTYSETKTVKNQYVVEFENGTMFQSYDTIIGVKFNGGKLYLSQMHDHSTTTSKYCKIWCDKDAKERREGLKNGTISPMK